RTQVDLVGGVVAEEPVEEAADRDEEEDDGDGDLHLGGHGRHGARQRQTPGHRSRATATVRAEMTDALAALGWSDRWLALFTTAVEDRGGAPARPGRVVRHDGVALLVADQEGTTSRPV